MVDFPLLCSFTGLYLCGKFCGPKSKPANFLVKLSPFPPTSPKVSTMTVMDVVESGIAKTVENSARARTANGLVEWKRPTRRSLQGMWGKEKNTTIHGIFKAYLMGDISKALEMGN